MRIDPVVDCEVVAEPTHPWFRWKGGRGTSGDDWMRHPELARGRKAPARLRWVPAARWAARRPGRARRLRERARRRRLHPARRPRRIAGGGRCQSRRGDRRAAHASALRPHRVARHRRSTDVRQRHRALRRRRPRLVQRSGPRAVGAGCCPLESVRSATGCRRSPPTGPVLPGIDALLAPGHTPGSTMFVISEGERRVRAHRGCGPLPGRADRGRNGRRSETSTRSSRREHVSG